MKMFCYQCQEASKGIGCSNVGVCGKNYKLAHLQDLLIYLTKGISDIVYKNNIDSRELAYLNQEIVSSLFMTITNSNFDENQIIEQILTLVELRDELIKLNKVNNLNQAAICRVDKNNIYELGKEIGVLSTCNEDIRSLRELISYGIKGMAAYLEHAYNLSSENMDIYNFIYKALASCLDDSLSIDDLFALSLETGSYGIKAMDLLDKANRKNYGNPEISKVNIGVRKNPAILVSGHDLKDLESLLKQSQGSGVDIYTHSEMLPAHYYPNFKSYDNLVGNYGNAWWKQLEEFDSFNGPILFTSNCIVPPKDEKILSRIFTTGSSGFPDSQHILEDAQGEKDFTSIIELAKKLDSPREIESGSIVGGFAHNQVFDLLDQLVDAIEKGHIKNFFVMAGCDGRMKSREYYSDFAKKLPKDSIILTAGCAKYRYNKLDLGHINGIPRVLDAGQCNDSYSLVLIALKLQEILKLEDINDLPIIYNISWYEQKAVIVLLALLSLGVKNIHLGPSLPAFLSDNVRNVLINQFNMSTISTVDQDLSKFLK